MRTSMGPVALRVILGVVASVLPHLASAQLDDAVDFAAAPPPAGAGVSKGSNKKIAMVTNTLKDILQSVVNEEKTETALYTKYSAWCGTEQGNIAKDLKETRTELANAKVLHEEQQSSIASLSLDLKARAKEIEETKDAIAQAVALRTDENERYTEDLQMNTQSLRQIDAAVKHVTKVQKQGGFLQNGVMKKVQVNQPGESSYVLGIMKGLKDKLEKTRVSLKKMEAEKVTMHNSFMDTKGKSMKALSDSQTEKKVAHSEVKAKEAGTKQKVGKLTEEVGKIQTNAEKTSETCLTSKSEWTVRQADRTKEKAALNEAVRYLTETALEQFSLVQQSIEEEHKSDEEHASVVFAPSFVQLVLDTKLSENAFYAAAGAELMGEDDEVEGHLKKDTFNGVQSVVQKLIGSHQDTQTEEKTKKEYCETEIASKEDEQSTTSDDLDAVKANIQKKEAEVITLADEVKTLYTSIDTIRKSVDAAGKLRKQEAAVFVAGSKDRALAVKVLSQARTVLQNFYDKSMMQTEGASDTVQPPAKWKPGSPRKKTAAFGAVQMVQDIADDITKEQKDAAIGEREAADQFTELQQTSQKSADDKQQDITDRVTAKAKLGVQINTLKETRQQKSDDLTSINKQLDALHKSCDELVKFYDKRTKARSFEVSQLRDVMDILSGSSIAQRTGLMQADDAFTESPSQDSAADGGDQNQA